MKSRFRVQSFSFGKTCLHPPAFLRGTAGGVICPPVHFVTPLQAISAKAFQSFSFGKTCLHPPAFLRGHSGRGLLSCRHSKSRYKIGVSAFDVSLTLDSIESRKMFFLFIILIIAMQSYLVLWIRKCLLGIVEKMKPRLLHLKKVKWVIVGMFVLGSPPARMNAVCSIPALWPSLPKSSSKMVVRSFQSIPG